jgi:hypothetical protein
VEVEVDLTVPVRELVIHHLILLVDLAVVEHKD